jgi:hypothetical protein
MNWICVSFEELKKLVNVAWDKGMLMNDELEGTVNRGAVAWLEERLKKYMKCPNQVSVLTDIETRSLQNEGQVQYHLN